MEGSRAETWMAASQGIFFFERACELEAHPRTKEGKGLLKEEKDDDNGSGFRE